MAPIGGLPAISVIRVGPGGHVAGAEIVRGEPALTHAALYLVGVVDRVDPPRVPSVDFTYSHTTYRALGHRFMREDARDGSRWLQLPHEVIALRRVIGSGGIVAPNYVGVRLAIHDRIQPTFGPVVLLDVFAPCCYALRGIEGRLTFRGRGYDSLDFSRIK